MPLSIGGGNGNSVPYAEKDNSIVIPLWGEEIIINKRMAKLGEIFVKKSNAPRTGNLEWMSKRKTRL
ncbi:MAG: hypothetical protein WKF36_04445 [Candidatus Nitrosocosmicus sp.]